MPCPTLPGRKAWPVDSGDKNKVGTSARFDKMPVGAFQGESGMVRLVDLPAAQAQRLAAFECPQFATEPWVTGPPLSQRRVAIVSSAGLLVRGGIPFRGRDPDYHAIPPGTPPSDLLISHVSINFDRTGFQEDWNVAFPRSEERRVGEGCGSEVWP